MVKKYYHEFIKTVFKEWAKMSYPRSFLFCNYFKVMKLDPFHEGCLPIHITCLIELRKPNDLFLLAHRLVELYPEWTISW